MITSVSTNTHLDIPYRYDLGPGRNHGISYFVNDGLRQGILSVQNSRSAYHQFFSVVDANSSGRGETGRNVLTKSLNALVLL